MSARVQGACDLLVIRHEDAAAGAVRQLHEDIPCEKLSPGDDAVADLRRLLKEFKRGRQNKGERSPRNGGYVRNALTVALADPR